MKKTKIRAFSFTLVACSAIIFSCGSCQTTEGVQHKSEQEVDSRSELNHYRDTIEYLQSRVDNLNNQLKSTSDTSDHKFENEDLKQFAFDLNNENKELKAENNKLKSRLNENQQSSNQFPFSGAITLSYRETIYHCFIGNINEHNIELHLNDDKGQPLRTFQKVISTELAETPPLCLMNGGMYKPDLSPVGLYISEGEKHSELNTKNTGCSGFDNFWLGMNGVFYMDSTNVGCMETSAFQKSKKNVILATQSGPMLLNNGVMNPCFNEGSPNRKIRNGIGIINNETFVMVITAEKVNLFDFSMLFQEVFHSKNALYLDGFVSRIYLPELNLTKKDQSSFGPMLSVTKKEANE